MIVFLDCEPDTHKIWRNAARTLAQGVPGEKHWMTAEEFTGPEPWPGLVTGVVHFHYHGAAALAIATCRKLGIPHYWIEGAYVNRDRFFRITKNRNQAQFRKASDRRFADVFEGVKIEKWRPVTGQKILFCETASDMTDFDPRALQWEADVRDYLESVRRSGDIVYRGRESKKPLREDLAGAECLISYNSNAAIESLLAGVPVIVSPESICFEFSRWNLLNLWRGDRQALWNLISESQFTLEEMADGVAWECVK